MSKTTSLIRELAKHALSKRGAQQEPGWRSHDPLEEPPIELPYVSEGQFFEMDHDDEGTFVRLPVHKEALARHRATYPVIRESSWVERDGHIYLEVPLDAELALSYLKSLIDDAHAIVWNKLDEHGCSLIELAEQPYDEPKLLDQLLEMHDLREHRKEIRKLARHAILLRTRKSAESKMPLGATKIGGRPDLPSTIDWPLYRNDKPLAFLAQLDLAEIAGKGTPIKGLPSEGLLSVFSVWGWLEEGGSDPHPPDDDTTVVLHTLPGANLERRRTPPGVNSFEGAAVEPILILSLPNHREEPPLTALDWTEEEHERFESLQSDYRSLQMSHWFQTSDEGASHHLLGGYALFQQEFPEEVLDKGLAMFLQIGTDDNTGMCWGDGGELTFYADDEALRKGRLERLWGTCQCG